MTYALSKGISRAFYHFLRIFIDCQAEIASVYFYKYFKAISLAFFIQILCIYKWHAKNFNVLFFAYDVMIQVAAIRSLKQKEIWIIN